MDDDLVDLTFRPTCEAKEERRLKEDLLQEEAGKKAVGAVVTVVVLEVGEEMQVGCGMTCEEHIREMIVVVATDRREEALEEALALVETVMLAGGEVAEVVAVTVAATCPPITGGRRTLQVRMTGTRVAAMEAEEDVVGMEEVQEEEEEDAVVLHNPMIGPNLCQGTRDWRRNCSDRQLVDQVGSTSIGTRIFRWKRLGQMFLRGSTSSVT